MRDDYRPTVDHWTHLLSIATRLLFDRIRRHAITKLTYSQLRPLNMVVLALKYDVGQWLEPAYTVIVCDHTTLSFEDLSLLPWTIATMLLRAREIYHHSDNAIIPPNSSSTPSTSNAAGNNKTAFVFSTNPGPSTGFGLFGRALDSTHKRTATVIIAEQLLLLKKYQDTVEKSEISR